MTDEETSREAKIPDELLDHAFDLLNALPVRENPQEMVAGILPNDELRFILEFEGEANAQRVIKLLRKKIPVQSFLLEPLFHFETENASQFNVLRFNQSSDVLSMSELFDVSYVIQSELQLLSCEPDHVMFLADMVSPSISPTPTKAPSDKHWSIKNIRANKAHNTAISKGADIRIGLPGVLEHTHRELEESAVEVISSDPFGLVGGETGERKTPITYVLPMAVVAASGQTGEIVGAAPKAKIVSIGSADSDLNCSGSGLARAIEVAVNAGCQIIVLGQCGTYCRAVEYALEKAITENVIVLAAAGDRSGSVAYPARYPGVIAVGGSTSQDLPWDHSGFGQKVAFVAPAESVWTAGQFSSDDVVPQNATAFAAALSAGGAALWLAHHGADTLIEQSLKRSCTVQELFRRAVRCTARQPNNWDNTRYGAGIVDCEALIKLSPDKIPEAQMPLKMFTDQISEMASLVQEIVGQLPNVNKFDFASYSAEISALAHARLNDGDKKFSAPSKFLRILIGQSGDKALMQLLNQS